MNSIWLSLLWKEWREVRWRIGVLSALVVAAPLTAGIGWPAGFFEMLPTTLTFYVLVAGVLFGIGAAAGENSARTSRFLQSLPARTCTAAVVKLGWAATALIVPVLVVTIVAVCWQLTYATHPSVRQWFESGDSWAYRTWGANNLFALPVSALLAGLSILVWSAAAGVNRSDEVRAAAIAILVIVAYWAGLSRFDAEGTDPLWFRFLIGAAPCGPGMIAGWLRSPTTPPYPQVSWLARFWPEAAGAIVMHSALVWWYVARFGRVAPGKRQEIDADQAVAVKPVAWLAPPRRSQLSSIVWKQIRESAPLALLGAGLIALAAVFGSGTGMVSIASSEQKGVQTFATAYLIWIFAGCFVGVVAGIGVFMDDLRPGIHAFWRSRPINIDQWFAVKFFVGLVVTVVTLATAPALLGAAVLATVDRSAFASEFHGQEGWSQLASIVLLQIGMFSVAAATMVILRHPLYAAFTGLAAPVVVLIIGSLAVNTHKVTADVMMGIVVVLVFSTILLAWQALRRDWGWKR